MPTQDSLDGLVASAAPAALIGLGAAGGRIVSRVRARFVHEIAPNADGLLLLTPDGSPDALTGAVRDAVRRLTRQRSIEPLEQRFAIRRPARRYLTLHLIFAATLAETDADALIHCLRTALALEHPAAGLEVLFVLDVTAADGNGGVAPDAASVMQKLEEVGLQERERQGLPWSAPACLRFLLAHPLRADGSRLDHPCLAGLVPSGSEMSAPSSGDANASDHHAPSHNEGDEPAEDEFEEALATVLAGHLSAGPFFDGLAAGEDRRPFALWGWARGVLPREPILSAVTERLTADALVRTESPESGEGARDAEALVQQDAPGAWETWVRTRADVLLDRRLLLKRLLLTERPGAVAVEDAPPPAPARRSWYARLLRWFMGSPETPVGGGRPLGVRLPLPSPGRQSGDPVAWPEALQRLDEEGTRLCDAVLEELRARDRPQEASEEVCLALARCVDICVRRHLGGSKAAREIIGDAMRSARGRIAEAGTIPLALPPVPEDAGLPGAGDTASAWAAYRQRCSRQPTWPAVLAAGLSYGALGVTACATLGLPALLLGWPFAAACVLIAAAIQSIALARLRRLGDYLHACVEVKYGRRLLEWAEQAAGSLTHEGVYQAVLGYLRDWEEAAVEQFEAERTDAVARLRRPVPFPPADGTDEHLIGPEAVEDVHAIVQDAGGETVTADDARSLLRRQDAFADWRIPALDQGIAAARPMIRHARLGGWERAERSLGDFLRGLLEARFPGDLDAAFSIWVRHRMDRLTLRAVPLALLPPTHPERDEGALDRDCNVAVSVIVAAPASLDWRASDGTRLVDPPQPPVDSGVQDLIAWFGAPSPATSVITEETDEIACLLLIAGLSASEALSAFPPLKAPPVSSLIAEPVAIPIRPAALVNGSTGNGSTGNGANGNGNGSNGNGHAHSPSVGAVGETAPESGAP